MTNRKKNLPTIVTPQKEPANSNVEVPYLSATNFSVTKSNFLFINGSTCISNSLSKASSG